ncbi:MAG: acylphosphatase [Actinomycetota bacterium]|nr:acylphosphatase [Actinomycetota bacterium]
MRRAHVYVSGRVQGVFFRQRTVRMAREEGLGGWVRNLPDGRLEAVFEGDARRIDKMIEWCRRGPEMAVVDEVELAEEEPEGLESFEVRR